AAARPAERPEFRDAGAFVIGTVGRMQPIKAQTLLAQAFVEALRQEPQLRSRLRLALVGDGPLHGECQALLQAAGVAHLAWLPGVRSDVPEVMKGFDVFALPSLAEGISNTILEAMASGLPVLATAVGGNGELVDVGRTGVLVQPGNVQALAQAIIGLALAPEAARAMGQAGRRRAEQSFSLPAMVAAYQQLYERLLAQRLPGRHNATQRGI
ncbi:MAG TPA: glycosyltransferase, partial [Rubrivivax sp.]|nr:glycosyltransferase [Rubrivivax sp.]